MRPMIRFALVVAPLAFISIISFFQINSYWSDKHHFNGLFGWLGIGIVTGLLAIWQLYYVIKQGGGGSSTGIGVK